MLQHASGRVGDTFFFERGKKAKVKEQDLVV
jgi:hypothetical protein